MEVKPVIDRGQELATPEGQAIGYAARKEQFDAMTTASKAADYADSKVIASRSEDGLETIERSQDAINLGVGDDAIMEHSTKQLPAGRYVLGIESNYRAGALRAASRAEPLCADSFSYAWVNERLTR